MREIKFRAWDSKNKEFIANGDSMNLYYSAKCNAFMFDNDNYDLDRNTIFLQYTGLKDKNDKEIYEGDICTIEIHFEDYEALITTKIFFQHGAFWFSGDHYTDCNWHHYDSKDIEVIGNIYENKELTA